jgi:hypothetical protein
LTGAAIFGLTYDIVFPRISALANVGNVVMPDLWNVNPFLAVLLFALFSGLLFYLIDRAGLFRKKQIEN